MGKTKNNKYDGVIWLDTPIRITPDKGETRSIYGILYNKKKSHKDDLFIWGINRYLTYLVGCERMIDRGGNVSPEMYIMPSGRMIILTLELKNFIYRILKDKIPGYKLLEYAEPLTYTSDEVDRCFVISQSFLVNNADKADALNIKITDVEV